MARSLTAHPENCKTIIYGQIVLPLEDSHRHKQRDFVVDLSSILKLVFSPGSLWIDTPAADVEDFFDQSLDEIKLLKYINVNGNVDHNHVLRQRPSGALNQ